MAGNIVQKLLECVPGGYIEVTVATLLLAAALFTLLLSRRIRENADENADPALPRRLEYLDGIRGLAMIAVVIFHVWQQSWMWPTFDIFGFKLDLNSAAISGFLGVEILFVLSGFCLFLPYASDSARPFDARAFYKKRLIRILPSYFFSMAVLLIFDRGINIGSGMTAVGNVLSNAFFVSNITGLFGGKSVNGVYWSLAVEMQFYLFFPLIARAMKKHPHITMAAAALVANGYRLSILAFSNNRTSAVFNQLPGMIDLFVIGMYAVRLAACLKRKCDVQTTGIRRTAIIGMNVLFALSTAAVWFVFVYLRAFNYAWTETSYAMGNQLFQLLVRPLLGLLVAVQMISGVFLEKHIEKVFANPVFKFVARISLNLYLWHQWIAVKLREGNIFAFDAALYERNQLDPDWSVKAFWGSIFVAVAVAYAITVLLDERITKKLRSKV